MRRAGGMAGWPAIALAIAFCLWAGYSYFGGANPPYGTLYAPIYSVLALCVPLSVAIFVPAVAANLAAGYRRSLEYELVCATGLTDGQLAWGYVAAALYRCRALVVAALGILPVATAAPLGVLAARIGAATPQADLGRWLALTMISAVGLVGWYVLLACLTVALYLWWRFSGPAQAAALLLGVGLWLVSDAALRQLSAWGLDGNWPLELASKGLAALLPFGAAAGAMLLARSWARSPLRSPLVEKIVGEW